MYGMESFKALSILNTPFGVTARSDKCVGIYPLPTQNQLTNSKGQIRSWKANSSSASQEIPRILCTLRFISLYTRARALPTFLPQIHYWLHLTSPIDPHQTIPLDTWLL
jgi:hypothetical protein